MLKCLYRLLVVSSLILLAGCAYASFAANAVTGGGDVPPEYKLAKVPTLVLVDDYSDASSADVDVDRLARYIQSDLTEHKVTDLIDLQKVSALRDQDRDGYQKLTIAQIGQAVGARQVIYINLSDYSVQAPAASDRVRGSATMRVKVIDVATGANIWPTDAADGRPVNAATDYVELDPNGGDLSARMKLDEAITTKIGKLFYSWSPNYEGDDDDKDSLSTPA